MRAIGCDIVGGRPRDQPALGTRMTRAGGDVIGIEQEGKAFVENFVGRIVRPEQELLEEPGDVRAVPFGRARIRHRLDLLVLGRQRRGARLGFRPHAPEGLAPRPRAPRPAIAAATAGPSPMPCGTDEMAVRAMKYLPGQIQR